MKRFPDRENYRDCRNTITKDGFLCLKNCLTTRQCKSSNNKKRKTVLTLSLSLHKDIVFPTQTKYYPYFSTDFKLRTFLRIQTSGKVKAGSSQPPTPTRVVNILRLLMTCEISVLLTLMELKYFAARLHFLTVCRDSFYMYTTANVANG